MNYSLITMKLLFKVCSFWGVMRYPTHFIPLWCQHSNLSRGSLCTFKKTVESLFKQKLLFIDKARQFYSYSIFHTQMLWWTWSWVSPTKGAPIMNFYHWFWFFTEKCVLIFIIPKLTLCETHEHIKDTSTFPLLSINQSCIINSIICNY